MKTAVRDNRFLRSERAEVLREARALQEKGNLSAADQARFTALMSEARSLMEEYEGIESRSQAEFRGGPVDGGIEHRGKPDKEIREAFSGYLRNGMASLEPEARALLAERRDMGSGGQGAYPGATTGFFVPVGFVQQIEEALKYYGPMLNGGPGYPQIFDTATGQVLPYPCSDDTMNIGEIVGEGQQVTAQDTNISAVNFGAFKFSSKLVKVSVELIQDSAFDLEAYLIREFARRLGRIANTKLTIGQGTTEPTGILTALIANGNPIVQAVGSALNTGNADGTNTVGSDDMIALEHSVDPLYRPGARYMMHDTALRALKRVKDKYGRPLWQESTRDGQPATINGYEYCINNDLDQLQTSATSPGVVRRTIIFGQLPKYICRRARQMSVLRLDERFADFLQVGFLAVMRLDGNSIDIGHRALALLENTF